MLCRTKTAALSVALTLAACLGAPLAVAEDDPVVATFDGGKVRLSEVVELHQAQPQLNQLPVQMVFPKLVDSLVSTKIMLREAEKNGLRKDDAVRKMVARAEEDYMVQIYLSRELDKVLTEDKLRAEYKKIIDGMPKVEEVHARHILLETEEAAKTVIGILGKGGDFATLAKERSTGPSAESGGDLGYFKEGDMNADFSAAAFALKPGEVSKTPVKTEFGWHVIKVEDRREATPPTFEQVRDQVAQRMEPAVINEIVDRLRAGKTVTLFNMDGTPVKN